MIQEISDDFLLADFGSSVAPLNYLSLETESFFLLEDGGRILLERSDGLGIMDRSSQIIMNDNVVTVDYALTARTDLFGGLHYDDQVEHEDVAYRLQHEPLKLADGRFCVMVLERLLEVVEVVEAIAVFELDVFVLGVFE